MLSPNVVVSNEISKDVEAPSMEMKLFSNSSNDQKHDDAMEPKLKHTNFRIDFAYCNPKIKFAQQSGVCTHSVDSVLLAGFVPLEKKSVVAKKNNAPLKIMDLCTGNAAIPMLLYYRLKYLALEREEIEQEKKNRYLNSVMRQRKPENMEPHLSEMLSHDKFNENIANHDEQISSEIRETCSIHDKSVDSRFAKVELPCIIKGVEIQDDVIALAQKTLELNEGSSSVIEIIHNDLTREDFVTPADRGKFDIVTCNPPYFKPEEGTINHSNHISIAKFEIKCNLKDVVSCAAKLLKNYGLFVMVHRACRLSDILVTLREYRLEVRRMQFVFSRSERRGITDVKVENDKSKHVENGENLQQSPSNMSSSKKKNSNKKQQQQPNATTAVLIEAVKVQTDSSEDGADSTIHSFLHVMEPLYLYENDSSNIYTKEVWNEVFSKFNYHVPSNKEK
ncbi:hypothetical protein C9374_011540 [Naegleria lovaniensis]|uniref:Methyltransferase small domain-containing protein n=1 Tax=Naegleria lovaniensis TaxID=51637 RepID=A0AA88KWT8_NAELO|nr:uncharacterized protein C9374_011540 [Naegleria lovaniensis]KAG2392815.1 hypothetical protein C9374_011540 [Naegleria lovaniensis]